jgi:chemotaxis protein CheZ
MPEEKAEAPPPASRDERLSANYEGIARVLKGSARGRWVLAEHARRSRAADTSALLEAIVKLELSVLRSQHKQSDQVLADLLEMSEAIERTRAEIAAIKPTDQLNAASSELDDIVAATEKATSSILGAAEEVQEVGWIMREKGAEPSLCDVLDARATEIYTTCSFQDLTGQRTEKVVKVLRFIEQRIDAMIELWGADDAGFKVSALLQPAELPDLFDEQPRQGGGLAQREVDAMLAPSLNGGPAAAPEGLDSDDSKPAELPDLSPLDKAALFG